MADKLNGERREREGSVQQRRLREQEGEEGTRELRGGGGREGIA